MTIRHIALKQSGRNALLKKIDIFTYQIHNQSVSTEKIHTQLLRNRPFNLQGGGGEGLWFLFRSEFFFRTTRELEYYFFCRAKRELFFFQNTTLRYLTKTLNQIFFPPTKSEYFFFQQHWESEAISQFLKLNGKKLLFLNIY